jgi:hypothetical protein
MLDKYFEVSSASLIEQYKCQNDGRLLKKNIYPLISVGYIGGTLWKNLWRSMTQQ